MRVPIFCSKKNLPLALGRAQGDLIFRNRGRKIVAFMTKQWLTGSERTRGYIGELVKLTLLETPETEPMHAQGVRVKIIASKVEGDGAQILSLRTDEIDELITAYGPLSTNLSEVAFKGLLKLSDADTLVFIERLLSERKRTTQGAQ